MDNQHVTIGEIFRIVQRIETQVMLQNGRVKKLEEDSIRLKALAAIGSVMGAFGLEWLKRKLGW